MPKRKKTQPVELYDHTLERNRATASTVEIDVANRRIKLNKRVLKPKVDSLPPDSPASTYPSPEAETQQITEDDVGVVVFATSRAKRYANSDSPLLTWLQYWSSYLRELLRRKGRGTVEDSSCCPMCHRTRAVMRCRECFGGTLLCGCCCVENHRQHPLHRIEEWTGDFFKKTSLRKLGLVMHLGAHNTQLPVAVNFCGCRHNLAGYQQLLRASWYPATPLNPETCVTIELLELFHLLNLQGNTTIYDFVKVMEMTTDGWLLERIPDRQQSFTTVVQEWRHLCMLMRAGQGHEPDDIPTTKPGKLAVQCRACPHPGYNLPDNFRDIPKGHSYLYWQTVAVDCNFRLKNRYRHSNNLDVTLSHGWAYFVEQKGYLEYVKRHANQQEMSTCAGFQAMLQANLKKAKGLNAMGVVGVACSRHELWRPNGMEDLQRGERQCNVDYVLVAALLGVTLRLLITYDIACQYFKLFWTRMLGLPAGMRLAIPSIKQVVTKVPKGHLRAHEDACQGPFLLNYTNGATETDGEGIERLWSWLNKAAHSAKEMMQASRTNCWDNFAVIQTGGRHLGCAIFLPVACSTLSSWRKHSVRNFKRSTLVSENMHRKKLTAGKPCLKIGRTTTRNRA
ncbi:hypothetical protein BC835DRAFT_1424520, partial [Cytidiella melzeri]